MNTFIYFRDLGCQGATEILENALELAKNECNETVIKSLKEKNLLFLTKNTDISTLVLASPFKIWQEIAQKAGIGTLFSDSFENLSANTIIIAEKEFIPLLQEKEINNIIIQEEHLYDYTMKSAISTFSTFLYTALRTNKNYNEISIAYMGDVGAQNLSTTNNLLNASICMKNLLSFAFSEHSARQEETGFDQGVLDFAMSAGAKIFLTYSPDFIENDCDILMLADWTYQPSKDLKVLKHPFSFEQIGNIFLDKTQLVSFLAQVESSEINLDLYKKAAITSRIATLEYMLTK